MRTFNQSTIAELNQHQAYVWLTDLEYLEAQARLSNLLCLYLSTSHDISSDQVITGLHDKYVGSTMQHRKEIDRCRQRLD